MRQAEEIARRKIAAINQPLEEAAKRAREAAERKSAAEQLAAERAVQANETVIDDLAKQLALFGDARRQFVDQALSRLSDSATDAQGRRSSGWPMRSTTRSRRASSWPKACARKSSCAGRVRG
ncbi:MAG: hypothetical protein HWD60_00085 [Defluviicoccus sp.]|nr:MAG: hypothetical protein HWD60_00085 [Defluviicoccus sp.]